MAITKPPIYDRAPYTGNKSTNDVFEMIFDYLDSLAEKINAELADKLDKGCFDEMLETETIILKSTESDKRFIVTVDDNGELTATEIVDEAESEETPDAEDAPNEDAPADAE